MNCSSPEAASSAQTRRGRAQAARAFGLPADLPRTHWAVLLVSLVLLRWSSFASEDPWRATTALGNSTSRLVPSLWEKLPRLNAKTKITIFEAQGPGVVTLLHVSALGTNFGKGFDSEASQGVLIRVFYEGEKKPSIEMPLMDFLGDIKCGSAYFQTKYFSKVKESHNFRLPMPFSKSIRIEFENPSDDNLVGYADVQWDKVERIPRGGGHLRAQYRQGRMEAKVPAVLFELHQPGKIVAHWLQFESEKSDKGETICEGNQELYLDGNRQPSLNYLGTEDVYGYSWGFKGTHFDQFQAILKQDELAPTGSRVAMLRCRDQDAISFQKSARWLLSYLNDQGAMKHLGNAPIVYRHCVYYYAEH